MMSVVDKPNDNWGWPDVSDLGVIRYEDGLTERFDLSLVVMDFWAKYRGVRVSDINDLKDLRFIEKVAVEKDDGFALRCARMRIQELK